MAEIVFFCFFLYKKTQKEKQNKSEKQRWIRGEKKKCKEK